MKIAGMALISAVIALVFHIAVRDHYIEKYGKTEGDKKVWIQTCIYFVIVIVFLSITFG